MKTQGDLRPPILPGLCGLTFALVLAPPALAGGSDFPDGSVLITQALILAGFSDSGDTCDNTDAFDVGPLTMPPTDCGASTAPDEWYRLEITSTTTVMIDLCGTTSYDSKIFVLDESGTPIACNDDGIGCPGDGGSRLGNLTLTPGTYDLAIDGRQSECGSFTVSIEEIVPLDCLLEHPDNCAVEGEPCDEFGDDNFNGGCNSTPEAFSNASGGSGPCGAVRFRGCGTNWGSGGTRDTDWWRFCNTQLRAFQLEVEAETDTVAFLARMSPGGVCPVIGIPDGTPAFSGACDTNNSLGVGYLLEPGDYVVFIGTGTPGGGGLFDGFPCPDGTLSNNAYHFWIGNISLPPPPCLSDLSENNTVDFADLLVLLMNWGPCPESASAVATVHRDAAARDEPRLRTAGTVGSSAGMCFLDPPCTGPLEGEPCDEVIPDSFNAGCNSTPEVFSELILDGPAVCGTNWANGGYRDTDWWRFNNTALREVEIEVRAEADTVVLLAEMSPGGVCPVIGFPDGSVAFSGDCDALHSIGSDYVLAPGDYVAVVVTGTASGGGVFDGFPCPDGTFTNNAYEVELRTMPPPPPPCPMDLNENGAIDFADVLRVIEDWGPCPCSEPPVPCSY